jgi:hypothetical protein
MVQATRSQMPVHCMRGDRVAMKYPPVKIVIEYDSRGQRESKAFTDHYKARRFYASKFKQGKNPTVKQDKA